MIIPETSEALRVLELVYTKKRCLENNKHFIHVVCKKGDVSIEPKYQKKKKRYWFLKTGEQLLRNQKHKQENLY